MKVLVLNRFDMTDEEFEKIVTEVVNRITTSSIDVAKVDVIDTTEEFESKSVNTLPCSTSDGTIVQVATPIFSKPAKEAAASANNAAALAKASSLAADKATKDMQEAFGEVQDTMNESIDKCDKVTSAAQQAADNIGNKKILVITEDQYTMLLNGDSITVDDKTYEMDTNTIYFATEE